MNAMPPPGRRRAVLLGAALLAALMALLLIRAWPTRPAPAPGADPFALPPVAASPFLNTRPGARYLGSAACLPCHEEYAASFRHTGMGRSLAAVDPAREPPDAAFDHPASKRRYEIRRKDGELWHRELLLGGGPEEVLLAEYPVKYVVGSGRHARTYLVETDGFLVESPVTWYPSRQAWGMSPGYDKPEQLGFMRAVGDACLFCHAGQAEVVGRSLHRMRITEDAIGCERCHGPGSLHVERHAGRRRPGGGPSAGTDDTIVNPARLSRDLAEAVCQQCHLNALAAVSARGRKSDDFRPGLRWQDFRYFYEVEGTGQSMTVVGHVEQMHLSRCYQASGTLSCLTCHDPHAEPAPGERTGYYRAVCLSCHAPERCTVDRALRARQSPDNDCVHCHMPRSATDIPHLAFTHHRIGIHREPAVADPAGAAGGAANPAKAGTPTGGGGPAAPAAGELRPFLELPPLRDADRDRALGLAYLASSLRDRDAARLAHDQKRALELLSRAHEAGLPDAEADAALAQLRFDLGLGDALPYAERALADPDLAGQPRCDALLVLAQVRAREGKYAEALPALRELTELRRHPLDYLLLATCERGLGEERAAQEALTTATRINPRLWNVHRFLAEHYRQQGDAARAAWHQRRAVP
jgi:predicted CXXCH cytochrome family protein